MTRRKAPRGIGARRCWVFLRWVLLLGLVAGAACSITAPSGGYTLHRVNGQPLPATLESNTQFMDIVIGGKLYLIPGRRFQVYYVHRFILYDGPRIERDTTSGWGYRGIYSWTDSTLVLKENGRTLITSTLRILEDGRLLQGFEDIPFFMSVEFVRDP